eukprot:m.126852 g.126852  ORF g.126852 m.126852 type:complete len:896 (-) comp19831_c2_seq1:79-2766(-)
MDDVVLTSLKTDPVTGLTLVVSVESGSLVVRWGDMVWETLLPLYKCVWQYVAISYTSTTGSLTVFTRAIACGGVTRSINNVLQGCVLEPTAVTFGGLESDLPPGTLAILPPVTTTPKPTVGRRSTAVSPLFTGGLDSMAVWLRALSGNELDADSRELILKDPSLRFELNFDDAVVGVPVTGDLFSEGQQICDVEVIWFPNKTVTDVDVSTLPLVEAAQDRCRFLSSTLRTQAQELCGNFFFQGPLWDACGALGPEVQFYHDACVCDVAKRNDLAYHKPSVCMFRLHCMQSGVTASTDLLDSYCDSVLLRSTQRTEASNVLMWITLLCVGLMFVFMLLWFALIKSYQKRKHAARAQALQRKQKEEEMEMGVFTGRKLSFENPMFDMDDEDDEEDGSGDGQAETDLGGLYMDEPEDPQVTADARENFQKDNGLIDFNLFSMQPNPNRRGVLPGPRSTAPLLETPVGQAPDTQTNQHNLLLLAALRENPWIQIEVDVKGLDVAIAINGQTELQTRLMAPVWDGPGHLRLGQRVPGLFRFEGEMRSVVFTESRPVDGDSNRRRLEDQGMDLLILADNPHGHVTEGAAEGSLLFNGKKKSFLDVPVDVHPLVSDRFRIACEVRCQSQPGGYLVAKTSPDGSIRYWAVGLVKTKRGLSVQFYYRPQGSQHGHRAIVCNTGKEHINEMDTDNVIMVGTPDGPATGSTASASSPRRGNSSSKLGRIGSLLKRHPSSSTASAEALAEAAGAAFAEEALTEGDLTARSEAVDAFDELERNTADALRTKQGELERAKAAEEAAAEQLRDVEQQQEVVQFALLDEAEVERAQALEQLLQPMQPAGLISAGALAPEQPHNPLLDPTDDDLSAVDAEDASATAGGAPAATVDPNAFLALASLFPDLDFW